MNDEMREAFEKLIKDEFPALSVDLLKVREDGKYFDMPTWQHLQWFINGCKWMQEKQINKDAEICDDLSGIPKESGTFTFTKEQSIKQDVCIECKEAIRNQQR